MAAVEEIPLTGWLRVNKLEDENLICELIEQGIEDIDDLLIFDENQLKDRLVKSSRKIKIGIVCKFMKALNKERRFHIKPESNNKSPVSSAFVMLSKEEKQSMQKLQFELIKIQEKLRSLPQQTKRMLHIFTI